VEHELDRDRLAVAGRLAQVHEMAVDFLESLDSRPVVPGVPAPSPTRLPTVGMGTSEALDSFRDEWLPTLVASAGPRWQGYVTGGATIASVAGDWLASALDQNVASSEGGAAQLERQAVSWVRDLLGLPAEQSGVMVTGASMSNVTCLAVAREWLGEQRRTAYNVTGLAGAEPCQVLSGAAHSCIPKALSLLGMGRSSLRSIALLPDREAVDLQALERAVDEVAGPVIVVANAGTVNSGDFDDLEGLLTLRDRLGFWLHVDAAFGAFAHLDDRCRDLVSGIGGADSVAIDLHKWMNVPYDSAVAFTRHLDLQTRVFHNSSSYQGSPGPVPDFLHIAPENSRRFRALPVWLALMAYGRDGHADIVRRCNDNARLFADELETVPGVDVLAAVRLNIVCFEVTETSHEAVLSAITESGRAFLTPTTYLGRPAIRAAFSNWRTEPAHVHALVEQVRALTSG
jgi:glutamate/tyrosine decarboxylase-like PLP-dependent enzyme